MSLESEEAVSIDTSLSARSDDGPVAPRVQYPLKARSQGCPFDRFSGTPENKLACSRKSDAICAVGVESWSRLVLEAGGMEEPIDDGMAGIGRPQWRISREGPLVKSSQTGGSVMNSFSSLLYRLLFICGGNAGSRKSVA